MPKSSAQEVFIETIQKYFSVLPYDKIFELNSKIYNAPIQERQTIWDRSNLPVKEIEVNFKAVAKARKQIAKEKGFQNYLDMMIDKYKIPREVVDSFFENKKKIIKICNENISREQNLAEGIYSNFNIPCLICQTENFPFKSLDEVARFMFSKYPIFDKLKNIEIKAGDKSEMEYDIQKNQYEITINNKYNLKHKSLSLIHELSHVVAYSNSFDSGIDPQSNGKYKNEKDAIKIQMESLKDISNEVYESIFVDILVVIRRIMFEFGYFSNPNKDLKKLYAETFNLCFPQATQIINPSYLLEEDIIMSPMNNLPHALAFSEIILEQNL